MGIVGLGEIGQELTRRAAAFGMNVIGVDPREDLRGIIDLLSFPSETGRSKPTAGGGRLRGGCRSTYA